MAASAADLRTIMQALQGDKATYRFAAIWWSEQDIKQAADDVHEKQRTQYGDNQGQENERDLDQQVRRKRQDELRKLHGGEARALLNPLRDLIGALAENHPREDASLFPNYSSWLKDRFDRQWQTNSVKADIEDFGTAKWDNRSLAAIVVRATIDQMNSVLGKYDHLCFDFGVLSDSEFKRWRNPIAVDCDSVSKMRNWEIGQGFQSEWNVPGAQ